MTEIFDARNAQGAINNAQANEINQNFGEQTTVDTNGGDVAGRDIVDNSVNNFFIVLGGNPEPNRESILNKLKKVLEEVDDPSIRQALRNSFKDRPIPTTEDTTEIIEQLGLEQLLKLIASLLNENGKITQPVREKLERIAYSVQQDDITPPASSAFQESRTLQSYLLIALRPEAGTDKYRINAWVIPDDTVLDPEEPYKGFVPLDINDKEKGTICLFNEVPGKVAAFLEQSLGYLPDDNEYLTIEVFLPDEYLGTNVNCWEFKTFDDTPTCIVNYCSVVLRSSERLNSRYLKFYKKKWRENWKKVKQLWELPSPDDFLHLDKMEGFERKKLAALLTSKQKIGLTVACAAPPEPRHKELFKAVHEAATPIAIWLRQDDIPDQTQKIAIFNKLIGIPLGNLPKEVRSQWVEAYSQEFPKQHLGYHLSILWDNPFRLPPLT